MSLEPLLRERSGGTCELCGSADNLSALHVGPDKPDDADHAILVCETCAAQISGEAPLDGAHWSCLNESAWSQVPAVQVSAWRLLKRQSGESWAQELLEMIYLEDETLEWAKAGQVSAGGEDAIVHKDTNGAVLSAGDTVTLIKDLKVKGANFTAKRGTAVRNISLVHDNATQIEGRVNDQRIVILTEFVKKA
ncbi:PhnA domain-containing protein [Roseibium litorale]|uniref:PhnA domain-containing protein n=1 Tax=Roseibium litorale TaxID=2803841 RepID=A0ABR9CNF7_9HYPH|nr:alkylphosphonate utilization protein [Roseibium litorale]MBD8892387.1 PhnA domain-containing protein [Roseibium litorale]